MSRTYTKDLPSTDIILWGAAGFVGRLVAGYLWPRYGATGQVSFALGGLGPSQLEKVHEDIKADDRLPLVVGNAFDEDFLSAMAKKAKVIVSTVGPYAKYGSALVAACAKNGADYCDLSGETQWMHKMINAHQKEAEASGARIVHTCGFDSIPSDMGVFFLQTEAQKRFGQAMNRVKLRVKSMRGGASGGTVASILNVIEEIRKDPEIARILKNPYALAPKGMRSGIRQPSVSALEYDPDAKSWIGPFMMAAVNTRVVHRSNALLGYAWGKDFKYDEAMMTGDGLMGCIRAGALAGTLGAFIAGAAFAMTRGIMQKTFLPKPGEGPTQEQRETGFYKIDIFGKGFDGNLIRARVTGDRDPGYGSTCKMLGESAICLLKDIRKKGVAGGFWTPSTAMGYSLIERLTANAGLTFTVRE